MSDPSRVWEGTRSMASGYKIVRRWTWTKDGGLRVQFGDGTERKSEWTLPEFLTAIKEGRESARELTECSVCRGWHTLDTTHAAE